MSLFDPIIDKSFREYADLQLRRHSLLMDGKEQDPEFDEIEDRMTELWNTFDSTQRESANGMGSDLNWIRRKGGTPPKGRKAEEVTPGERQELLAAREREEWHRFLHYLRVCASTIPAVNLAYHRSKTYEAVGFPDYAVAFYEFTAELDPTNPAIGVSTLRAVDRVDPAKALRRAEQIIASPLKFPPVVVAMSVVIVLRHDEERAFPVDRERFSALLDEAVKRLSIEPPWDVGQAMAYYFAASGYKLLGDQPAAVKCYDEGLKIAPDNKGLLIGKGAVLYRNQTEKAVALFRQVVSNEGSPLVWPYFYLAHHELRQKNFSESLKMANQAWERATTNPVRAELLEWQAICFSKSGYPAESVQPLFKKAISLDPSNERIRRNSEAFEESLTAERETIWDFEAEETLRIEINDAALAI